ncbi:protein TIC 22, chloroplastic isoform X3 [Amborella trichopoda]|uniref:protein TIC 22, chloroplastic isoform X3 n=1 Tax=Amborella trichopoda TaxID=13333 RepID=UPI0009BFF020|nr:protein TIC 22, chloroplastic isoform X3 [Amborella trichopoda]|eukprot:XP_020517541.1 protein TIC 22, chloroplastic isoform X3 [Amborella trichopoda]
MGNASFPILAMDSPKHSETSSSSSNTTHFQLPWDSQAFRHLSSSVSGFIDGLLPKTGPAQKWLTELGSRIEAKRCFGRVSMNWPRPGLLFAAISQEMRQPKHVFDIALSPEYVAKTLSGTSVYTVSNSNNEFVLISDPSSQKSLGLLCFRQEDAEALLAQAGSPSTKYRGTCVKLRQPVLGRGARVVPIALEQVYMLKVEGIAFRFLPDPVQVRNAMELKNSDLSKAFDGVPVFQEDIERELLKVSRASRGPASSQRIVVGSLEDILKKMELNKRNSGWEDLIFIAPGKSYSQYFQEVTV